MRRLKSRKVARFAVPFLGIVIVATFFSVGHADRPQGRCAGDPQVADLAHGEGTVAILNRDVVVIGEETSACVHQRTVARKGLLRHVAARPGTGTAFVQDMAGDDTVVLMTPEGTSEVDGGGEVTQPAWSQDGELVWARDMQSLSVLSPDSMAIETIRRPKTTLGVFSPRFVGLDSILAVAREPVDRAPSEDDALNNLFEYDLNSGIWNRLTSFTATAEQWSAIRTPQVMPDGSVLFVRVAGNVHETRLPDFELWRESEGRVERIRRLPQEMYLAGVSGESLLWNITTPDCGDWELFLERGAELAPLGCGAVGVDPVSLLDPDLVASSEMPVKTSAAPLAVVVGDFASRPAAKSFARQISGSAVVSHVNAPPIVRPGAFAVVQPVARGEDAEIRLAKMRKVVHRPYEAFIAPLTIEP